MTDIEGFEPWLQATTRQHDMTIDELQRKFTVMVRYGE
jgi:hypothetical protein